MKKYLLIIIPILLTSCMNESNIGFSEKEKLRIENEIDSLIKIIVNGYSSGNLEKAFQYYDESTNFKYVGMDGSITSLSTLKNTTTETYQLFLNYEMEISKSEIIIYQKDLVLSILTYNFIVNFKSGEKLNYENAVASFLWKKRDNKWKIIFQSESGLSPAEVDNK